MSSIVTEQGILHYESIGRGKPIILLHGWINSWDVWRKQMIDLANTKQFRVYALDFWGFGDSAKSANGATVGSFKIDSYVDMVYQFMDRLGIRKAPIFGHSMGGTVALQMALAHPERVSKVAVVGSPIVGTSLNPMLRLAGIGAIAKLVWRYPLLLHTIMRILLAGDSPEVRKMIFRDVQRTTIESFFKSIGDLHRTDLRDELLQLKQPILGIYGAKDNIVLPKNGRLLETIVTNSQIKYFPHARHFPMTDEPDEFLTTMKAFLLDEQTQSIQESPKLPL